MHNIDRNILESNFENESFEGSFESGNFEYEQYEMPGESSYERWAGEGETYESYEQETVFNEAELMELAAELLEVRDEAELDHFLGKLLRSAGRAIGKVVKSPIGRRSGVFAFNHAGFSTYSDNLMRFARDPFILAPIMLAVMIGSLGFPVIHELAYGARSPSRWSVHSKMTVFGSVMLLVFGFVAVASYEWDNLATIGALAWPEKLLNAAFHSVMTRSAGFNSVDIGRMERPTLAVSDALMLIGGGSAGTAGGIKITTFLILGFVVWAEVRGETDTTAFRRRISQQAQRQALSVVLLAVGIVAIGVLIMLSLTDFAFEAVLFEVVSAFATTGLSTGITPHLPTPALGLLTCLMFLGRVGTITVASVLALKERSMTFRYPEERPIVG